MDEQWAWKYCVQLLDGSLAMMVAFSLVRKGQQREPGV